MNRTRLLVFSGMLAALSLLLQFYHLFYKFVFIDIDIVGLPWMIASMLFGLEAGLIVSGISAIGIAFIAETQWVGAAMKFFATIVAVVIIGAVRSRFGFNKKLLFAGFLASMVLRPVLMVFFNYYFAIPVFFKVPTEAALKQFPVEIVLVANAILMAIEFALAYFIVFKTRLRAQLNVQG